jgi:predicted RNA-binding protein YlqC (UPF0109 family)
MVSEPQAVRIKVEKIIVTGKQIILVNVSVAAGDVGKIVGRQGRTARSLRIVLTALAMQHGCLSMLNIHENGIEELDPDESSRTVRKLSSHLDRH